MEIILSPSVSPAPGLLFDFIILSCSPGRFQHQTGRFASGCTPISPLRLNFARKFLQNLRLPPFFVDTGTEIG
ncbi:MAG: hypothetical protein MRZ73_09425 [Pseudoflavonifractor capillosus]|nr:hypothetical protein [Pseudoflavonifractor capillosus]